MVAEVPRGSLWAASAPETRCFYRPARVGAKFRMDDSGSHWSIAGAEATRPWPRSAWSSRKTDSLRKPPDPESNGQAGMRTAAEEVRVFVVSAAACEPA